MPSHAHSLPGLPAAPKTHASYKVWSDSTSREVKQHATLSKRGAVRLWHDARRYERQTRTPGRQDGAIGRNGLAILHVFLFDKLDYVTGRLDPGYETTARLACISRRSVARGLKKLKASKVLSWVRRCVESRDVEGRFELRQETNAYSIRPQSQWLGFRPPEPPPVEPWQIGATPPLPSLIDQAVEAHLKDAAPEVIVGLYGSDPNDKLAAAWAGFLGALIEKPQ